MHLNSKPLLLVGGLLVAAAFVVLWPVAEAPMQQGAEGGTGLSPTSAAGGDQRGQLGGGEMRSGLVVDAGVIDGAVARAPRPTAEVPEALEATEAAARASLAERQLQHLRAAVERAETSADPEQVRIFRGRIEALEEARRAASDGSE